jgi:hypothetical protein
VSVREIAPNAEIRRVKNVSVCSKNSLKFLMLFLFLVISSKKEFKNYFIKLITSISSNAVGESRFKKEGLFNISKTSFNFPVNIPNALFSAKLSMCPLMIRLKHIKALL